MQPTRPRLTPSIADIRRAVRSALDPAVPLLYVPYLFARGHGLRTTGQVAEALSAELGF